jgi:hypothetical protein
MNKITETGIGENLKPRHFLAGVQTGVSTKAAIDIYYISPNVILISCIP